MSKEELEAAVAAALERVMKQAAIDMRDVSLLSGVHISTIQRAAQRGELPFPVARIGQRYVIPSAPVRAFLHLDEAVAEAV